jgi:uncharacterized zinc-type alcohol dehydrogenase-like protein
VLRSWRPPRQSFAWRTWKIGKGHRVGIVGLGGLGHMGVKLARAMGAEVTVFSTSPKKKADALALGAHDFVVSSDAAALGAQKGRFDFILDTVSAPHDYAPLLDALKRDGNLTLVGAPPAPAQVMGFSLIMQRRSMSGSLIGGLPETQEMLDFCGKHEILSDIELLKMADIETGYERMLKNDVKYRFVIDIASLRG